MRLSKPIYKTTTSFIKGQTPGISVDKLVTLYKRELETQNVNHISSSGDTISFSNNIIRFLLDRYSNKFSGFSNGEIKISDEGDEIWIYLRASVTRTFISAGMLAGICILFSLFASAGLLIPSALGFIVFIILVGTGYLSTIISFPVYFTSLRNRIELELQNA